MEEEDTVGFDFGFLPQTREKTESLLIEKCQNALNDLVKGKYEEGMEILKDLLEHELVINEMHELRYQCFYNLAIAYEERKSIREALLYYYKCVSMKENDFNMWLKLSNYCMKLHYFEQAEYCYQNCLKYIPTSFYENMLFEKMIYTSFLTKNYTSCLQRIDFLLPKNFKSAELLLLKGIVSKNKGNLNEYEKFKKEAWKIDPSIMEDKLVVNKILATQPEVLPPLTAPQKGLELEKELFKEITITIDKYSWELFLKKLKNILKICYLLSENLVISKKLRKNNPIKSILASEAETYETIMSSLFRIKDKKEKSGSKHLKPPTRQEGNESPSVMSEERPDDAEIMPQESKDHSDFILREDSNSGQKPFVIVKEDKDKKKKKKSLHKEEVKEDFTLNRREKASARIQNIKTQQLYSNISLEYILSNFTFKNDMKFEDLIDMYKDDFLEFNKIKSDEDILSLHPPVKMAEEYDGINSMLLSFSQDQRSGINDTDRLKEKITKASNEDFLKFLKENHNKKYANVILFTRAVLKHFLQSVQRNVPKDLEDIPFYLEAKVSLGFCPSYHLTDYKKKMIIKIFLYAHHFCNNIVTDYSSKLALFEILIDYYYFKASSQVKEANIDKHNETMRELKSALSQLSQSLLFDKSDSDFEGLNETQSSLLKVRSILSFARFFLTDDFKCSSSAKECLSLLGQELQRLDNWMDLNTQMIENNIYINMFWMKDKLLMSEQLEILEDKIKQNDLKENVYQQTDNLERLDTEDKSAYLEGLFNLFAEKVKVSLDSAIEIHYKKLYQKITALKLNDFVLYFDKLFKVLLELLWQSNDNEDSRKVLVHAYQQLKIKELLGLMEAHFKHKKIKKLIGKDEAFTHKMANIANYLYRMIVINNVIDYMLDYELFLSLFFKTGEVLVKKLGVEDPIVSQIKFFRLFHWLVHLVPSDKANRYHQDLVKNSYRQDTTLKGLNYLKEHYGSHSAEKQDDKKKDQENKSQGEEDIKELIEEEILDIFACWYGIGSPSEKEMKDGLQKVKNFKDVVIFYKFLEYFYPDYLSDPTTKFKVVISKVLIDIFDYLKDHQGEWWDLCEGFKNIKRRFERTLLGSNPIPSSPKLGEEHVEPIELEDPSIQAEIEALEESINNNNFELPGDAQVMPQLMEVEDQPEPQNESKMEEEEEESDYIINLENDECFCSKKICFQNIKHLQSQDVKQTFSQIFYFIGKALDDSKPPNEGSDTLKQRKILIRIEKMYSISASFFPQDLYICNALSSTLIDQYLLYSDQLVYDKAYDKFIEFEGCLIKAQFLLTSLMERYHNGNYTLFFKDTKVEDIYAEILSNLKTTKLLKLLEEKFKLHLICSPSDEKAKESLRAQIKIIKEELKHYPITITYPKDYYLSGTTILSTVPMIFTIKENQALIENQVSLCEIFDNSLSSAVAANFDKSLLPLYELETETHLFVMLYKIFRKYLEIIKYLYSDSYTQTIQSTLMNLSNGFNSLEKIRKYFINDFNEFMRFIDRDKKIKFHLRRMIIEGKTSVDKAANTDEANINKPISEMVAEENSELNNLNGFLKNFLSEVSSNKEEIEKCSKKINEDLTNIAQNIEYTEIDPPSITEILKTAEGFIIGITKKLREISQRKETKRFRGSPFHAKCCIYTSQIFEKFFKEDKKALEIISQLLTGKCNEVVELYKYEKDSILSLVYNRDLLFLRAKHKVIKTFIRLSFKAPSKESFERSKFLHKKAYSLILINNEKVNQAYLRLYEITLEYILKYLEANIESIDSEFKKEKGPEEALELSGEGLDASKNVAWSDLISEALKNELKIIYEMIGNNIRSRNVAPVIKKNDELYKLICRVIILYYEKISIKYGLPVNLEKKFEAALVFFDQLYKKKRGGKKEDQRKDEDKKREEPKDDDKKEEENKDEDPRMEILE